MSSTIAKMPNIPIPLSRFKMDFNHSFDMFHGDVVPVDCFEVVPGDTFTYELSSLIRMSTPYVPLMTNIEANLHAVFVPMRLIWDDTEKFYGDPSNHDTVSSITPVNPNTVHIPKFTNTDMDSNVTFMYSVSDYLGKDDILGAFTATSATYQDRLDFFNGLNISCLKERAYCAMWNDLFRPSLLVPPVLINKSNNAISYSNVGTESFSTGSAVSLKYGFKPFKSFKKYDYFTSCTLSPQFGQSVEIPLGTYAPIAPYNNTNAPVTTTDEGYLWANAPETTNPGDFGDDIVIGNSSSAGIHLPVYADLASATAASINQLRYAFQVQKWLERSNYGDKFHEILNAHYGVNNPDLRLQRCQRLGSHKFYINISQVVSTAETTNNGQTTNIGQTGAVSVTGDKCNLFTAHFDEPGYVLVVITTKHERLYSSGFLREDLRKDRFEFYSPEFNNLGDQLTMRAELQIHEYGGNLIDNSKYGFGYQEHWAEYRTRKNLVSGSMRAGKSMAAWTCAEDFSTWSLGSLVPGYDFLKEDRDTLCQRLVSGSAGPDYVCDFRSDIIATREMSLHSIPGLIDHFGAL